MTVPVTARLDEAVVGALDAAVQAGLAPSRGAAVAAAVGEWLTSHGEDAIVASYARRYADEGGPAPADDDLVRSLASFSVAACLAGNGR